MDPTSDNPEIRAHLGACEACALYAQRHKTLDALLCAELRWEAPAALTAQLLAIAASAPLPAAAAMQPPARSRLNGWYMTLFYILVVGVMVFSTAVAWQLFNLVSDQIGFQNTIAQVTAAPAQWLVQLTREVPASRYIIDFFLRVRDQLMWLLLAAVLWAVLDKWNPQIGFGRRQQA